jgi:hypothetical protein
MILFLSGLLVAGYAVAALFFLRFWRQTRDRLFIYFGSAFVLLAVQRAALAASDTLPFETVWYYVLRLLAFVLIIVAIVEKNRSPAA